jgi:hypothetical protein
MRIRGLALFAGIVVLSSCLAAKKKEKQVPPDAVLRAQTVFVMIDPDAKEPLAEPNANLKAQKAVEEALMKWGKFRLALDTGTADIVISVQKGNRKGGIANNQRWSGGFPSCGRRRRCQSNPSYSAEGASGQFFESDGRDEPERPGTDGHASWRLRGCVAAVPQRSELCAGMDVFPEGRVEGARNASGGGIEKGVRGVGESRGGTGKAKAATPGVKPALNATANI